MREIDMLGLFGFMLLGLVALAYWRAVAAVVASMAGGKRRDAIGDGIHAYAGFLVVLFATFMTGASALVALKVLEPRPGQYPGGIFASVGAIVALVALGVVFAVRVVRPLAAAHRRARG